MKLCKDCFYCETITDSESKCNHINALVWLSRKHTNVVTGEVEGNDVYTYQTCNFMRKGYGRHEEEYRNWKCGFNAHLFKHREEMTEQALEEKKQSISDRIKNFFT